MLVLATLLLCSPPSQPNLSDEADGASTHENSNDYLSALRTVVEATTIANTDPGVGFEQLTLALDALRDHAPMLAVDPHGQYVEVKGQLALARAALVLGDRGTAIRTMDHILGALSLAGTINDFPLESVGPKTAALYHERRALWDSGSSSARLVVDCSPDSAVFIDGREVSTKLASSHGVEVPLGEHWVWVELDDTPLFRDVVEVTITGEAALVAVPIPAPPPTIELSPEPEQPLVLEQSPVSAPIVPGPIRMAPRWLEVPVVALGLGQVAAGSALLSIRSCGGNASLGSRCGLDTKLIGGAIVTTGATLVILGAVTLAIDEARARRHKRRQR